MPIFEFVCIDCGNSFDRLLRSSFAMSEVECPACSGQDVKKKLSVFSSKISGGANTAAASSNCAPGGL
jgi:putative FmdB family regulatory protein